MSVSSNLLCSFELLKPLDSSALKSHIKKGRNARQNMLNSPVSLASSQHHLSLTDDLCLACHCLCTELLMSQKLCMRYCSLREAPLSIHRHSSPLLQASLYNEKPWRSMPAKPDIMETRRFAGILGSLTMMLGFAHQRRKCRECPE
jgi:hypothetical protein